MTLTTRKIDSLTEVSPSDWNNLELNGNPFLTHHFLAGLETHGCLDHQGWHPAHILAESNGKLAGVLPLYFKSNSIGEFVFDWNWADAYERAGGHYYPKLVSAVPFTPVTGPRYLVKKDIENRDAVKNALYDTAMTLAAESGVSGLHVLFPDETDRKALVDQGLLIRHSCQYHWFNNGYQDFNDFLCQLTSKKRRQIKKERQAVSKSGITIEILRGREITHEHWNLYYEFYASTFHRKWGEPRLTPDFFQSLNKPDSCLPLLFLARYNDNYVAGAFAMQGKDTLYGRHWGCRSQIPYLHFELCYYQTIDYCIRNKLVKLDAGAQGEHKISRGFVPVNTWSAHWIANTHFRLAIENFLNHEAKFIDRYMKEISEHLAYKVT